MTEFLAVSWYIVPVVIVTVFSVIVFLGSLVVFFTNKVDGDDAEVPAKFALVAFCMLLFGSWLWPLWLPVGIILVLFKLVGEIIPSKKEN